MASPLVTFLENYHWKGYTVDTIVNNSNTMMCLHRGNFPCTVTARTRKLGVCLQSPRSMGMDPYGKVEYPMG